MNNSNAISLNESERADVLFCKLDDAKKIAKIIKTLFNDNFTAIDTYGKSILKSNKAMQSTIMSDPSIMIILIYNHVNFEDSIGKNLTQSFMDISIAFNTKIDKFIDKIEGVKKRTSESMIPCAKALSIEKNNYLKYKNNYEKACKDAEIILSERKKACGDVLLRFNMNFMQKLDEKVKNGLKELNNTENLYKQAIERLNTKNSDFNIAIMEFVNAIKVLYKCAIEKLKYTLQNASKSLSQFNTANEEILLNIRNKNIESMKPISEEAEDSYIDEKRSIELNSNGFPKGAYNKVIQKALALALDDKMDNILFIFGDIIQKHYEALNIIYEDRYRFLRHYKNYLQDMALANDTLGKATQKNIKLQTSGPLSKKIQQILDMYGNCIENLGKKFINFGMFIQSKISIIDNFINDQREQYKKASATLNKIIKDHNILKNNYFINAAKNDNLDRKGELFTMVIKKEGNDNVFENNEIKTQYKKSIYEYAQAFLKTLTEFRTQETSKMNQIKNIIDALIMQRSLLINEMPEFLNSLESIVKTIGPETEANLIIAQDDKISSCIANLGEIIPNFIPLFIRPPELLPENSSNVQELENNALENPDQENQAIINNSLEDEFQNKNQEQLEQNIAEEPNQNEIKLNLDPNEKIVDDFSCALKAKMLLQGRMYLYPSKIVYTTAKFLGDDAIIIPMEEIITIEKRTNAVFFDNSIGFTTKYGEIIFVSFFTRDKTFALIESLLIAFKEKNNAIANANAARARKTHHTKEAKSIQFEKIGNQTVSPKKLELSPEYIKATNSRNERQKGAVQKHIKYENSGEIMENMKDQVSDFQEVINANKIDNIAGDQKDIQPIKELESDLISSKKIFEEPQIQKIELNNEEEMRINLEKPASREVSSTQIKLIDEENKDIHLNEVIKGYSPSPLEVKKSSKTSNENSSNIPDENLSKKFLARKANITKGIVAIDKYPVHVLKETYPCSTQEFYSMIFSECPISYKGRNYPCFWYLFRSEIGDYDISYTKWNPPAPSYYTDIHPTPSQEVELLSYAASSTREYNFIHPLKEMLFAPKFSMINDQQTIYWVSPNEFIVQTNSFTSKVPMADTFVARNIVHVKEVGPKFCELNWRFWVEFVKINLFKGKIQSGACEEVSKITSTKFIPLFKDIISIKEREKQEKIASASIVKNLPRDIKSNNDEVNGLSINVSSSLQLQGQKLNDEVVVEELIKMNDEKGNLFQEQNNSQGLNQFHKLVENIDNLQPINDIQTNFKDQISNEDVKHHSHESQENLEPNMGKIDKIETKSEILPVISNSQFEELIHSLKDYTKINERMHKEIREEIKLIKYIVLMIFSLNILIFSMLFKR